MGTYNFSVDSPNVGAYKEQVVSDLFRQAGYDAVFARIAERKLVPTGESLTIPSSEELSFALDNSVTEDQLLPLSKITVNAKTIAMQQRGYTVSVTRTAKIRGPVDIWDESKKRLAQHMGRDMEGLIASALKTSPIKYVATGAATQNITTNGTASGTLAAGPNFYHMRYLSRYMQDNLRIPFSSKIGGAFGAVFRYSALQSLKSDSEYNEIHRGLPQYFESIKSIGRIEDFVVMPYNDNVVLNGAIGSGNAFSEGLLFGDECCYLGVQEDFGVYYDVSEGESTDFGRFCYAAYHGHMAAGLPSDSANAGLARVIHWTSA